MEIEKYELNKCDHDFQCPRGYWRNGMVYDDENLDPEVIATFDSKEDALAALAKHPCSASYFGGVGQITRATEYWVELAIYDEDDEPVEWPECYFGNYPYLKIYDKDDMLDKYPDAGLIEIVDANEDLKSRYDDDHWLALKVGGGKHTLCAINMDGEQVAELEVGKDE